MYVMSNDCAVKLLDHFREVQDHLTVNYLKKYLVILDVNEKYDGVSLFDHPTVVEDLPETLLLGLTNASYIDVHYYWESGLYNRFYMENQSLLYEKSFFYKENGLNLAGRELKVSLVVYTPFSYANFDVSIECSCSESYLKDAFNVVSLGVQ